MKRSATRAIALLALSCLALVAASCSTSTTAATSTSTSTSSPQLSGSITVSAASSLTATFTKLATSFRLLHPTTTVNFNFGSSGALATQIISGAPADVFASASPSDMTKVQASHLVTGTPVTFARNRLEIVVKPGDPLGIHSLHDLAKARVVALCVSTAPCGSTAQEALTKAGVTLPTSNVSLGANVDATLAQVTTGDADAAIVYVTNAATVGAQGEAVAIPPSQNVSTSYPIAVLAGASNRPLASAWVAYVVGPVGRAVLLRAHFLPPG